MDRHQVVGVLRQMEKFLKGQEMRFAEGLRIMKSKLAALQSSVSRLPQADQYLAPSTCPSLDAPSHGRKFGSKHLIGHEVHFACHTGYQLVGPATRVCQENGTWSGVDTACKDISECASNPCQNGGTCVEGLSQYKCICPQNWSGSHCQHQTQTAPPEWSVMNDPAFSRKPRCAKVDHAQHCSCDAGFHMSGTSDNTICQDVNECEVYKQDRGIKLCVHACVNVPGSFHCSCPEGYKLLPNGRSCEDVDECLSQQHNCTHGTTCINTGGASSASTRSVPVPTATSATSRPQPSSVSVTPAPWTAAPATWRPRPSPSTTCPCRPTCRRPPPCSAWPRRPRRRAGPDSLRFGIAGGNAKGLFVMQRSDRQTGS
ncbi:hypothetical protein ANANG_G00303480 [Anguilla anguilla]|uniref:Fibulin 7 n=1 Tax=Anguilla anguilla TaxID=7936 RepID=A0A9D3LL13_ANGAN|nr:hypothetical protein ANANG_G00303480 [Anguilla anguilla]